MRGIKKTFTLIMALVMVFSMIQNFIPAFAEEVILESQEEVTLSEDVIQSNETHSRPVNTGDRSNVMIWVILLAVSTVAILILTGRGKKKKKS